ncbi:MAG TPA: inositol monophosphatase family protein [Planctomycetota bacterium]|nr:inositol monophosphatase family protein [Planctomycetota bacterium]
MTSPGHDLQPFVAAALRLATLAGALLLRHRSEGAQRPESKGQRRELVTAADRAAEHTIVSGLLAEFPAHAILAEEGVLTVQGKASRESDWTWIIDPLDGTTNFVHGLPIYAVSIGLAFRSDPVVGVVHAPALGETFVASAGHGARRLCADGREQVLAVSRTTELADALLATGFAYDRDEPGRDDNLARIARVLPHCRDVRRLGSAELDLCYTAAGIYDGYWEQSLAPYDMAAGAVIVREAGGRVTDFAGGENWLFGGQVLATNARLHDELLRRLQGG